MVAADGVDIELQPGRVHALIGPNGSGKTTLLRLLAGDLTPDAGSVEIGGADATGATEAERVARGVARTLQATTVFPDLTALEHAEAGTEVRRRRRRGDPDDAGHPPRAEGGAGGEGARGGGARARSASTTGPAFGRSA